MRSPRDQGPSRPSAVCTSAVTGAGLRELLLEFERKVNTLLPFAVSVNATARTDWLLSVLMT